MRVWGLCGCVYVPYLSLVDGIHVYTCLSVCLHVKYRLSLSLQKNVATVHENLEEKQFLLFQCKLLFLSIGKNFTFNLRTGCMFYTLITFIHAGQRMSTI